MAIEEVIITSHINEFSHEEAIAVSMIREDPNFFFRYVKSFSITKQEIGPFYYDNSSLTNDKNVFVNYYLNGEHRESVHVAFPGTDTCIQRIALPRYTEEEPWLLNINLNASNTGPYQSRH